MAKKTTPEVNKSGLEELSELLRMQQMPARGNHSDLSQYIIELKSNLVHYYPKGSDKFAIIETALDHIARLSTICFPKTANDFAGLICEAIEFAKNHSGKCEPCNDESKQRASPIIFKSSSDLLLTLAGLASKPSLMTEFYATSCDLALDFYDHPAHRNDLSLIRDSIARLREAIALAAQEQQCTMKLLVTQLEATWMNGDITGIVQNCRALKATSIKPVRLAAETIERQFLAYFLDRQLAQCTPFIREIARGEAQNRVVAYILAAIDLLKKGGGHLRVHGFIAGGIQKLLDQCKLNDTARTHPLGELQLNSLLLVFNFAESHLTRSS